MHAELKKVYNAYGRAVVAEARSLLTQGKGLTNTSNLYKSIKYTLDETKSPKIIFSYVDYGEYVRKGRRAGSGKYKGGKSRKKLKDFVESLKDRYRIKTPHAYAIAIKILKEGISKNIPPFDFLTMARKKVKFPIGDFAKAMKKIALEKIKEG